MALLTAEFCGYNHHSWLTVQSPHYCSRCAVYATCDAITSQHDYNFANFLSCSWCKCFQSAPYPIMSDSNSLNEFSVVCISFPHVVLVCAVITNNRFGQWSVINQWQIQRKQLLVTTTKTHPYKLKSFSTLVSAQQGSMKRCSVC